MTEVIEQSNRSEYMKNYRLRNKEKIAQLQKQYYENNKEKLKEDFREYYIKNRTQRRLLGKKHYEENKEIYLAYSRTRKSLLKKCTPEWLTQEIYDEIISIYKECKVISERTGIKHHVDHIIPLKGKTVCGLHVPWNLQIITAEENLKKGNKYE